MGDIAKTNARTEKQSAVSIVRDRKVAITGAI